MGGVGAGLPVSGGTGNTLVLAYRLGIGAMSADRATVAVESGPW